MMRPGVGCRAGLAMVVALGLQSCAVGSLLRYKIAPNYPDDEGTQTAVLPGLSAPVTITFDQLGVPHLEAQNQVDLARATGFAQGRARFFQMDMMRRLARGRVSELVGNQPLLSETTVDYDRTMRGWELERRAQLAAEAMSPDDFAVLQAFAEGVNAAAATWLPLEYRLLGLSPEPWRPVDSLACALLNVWSLSHNWAQELSRLLLASSVGVPRMNQLYPSTPAPGARTVSSVTPLLPLPPAVAPELDGRFPVKRAPRPENVSLDGVGLDALALAGASNAWVVNGARSGSGKPLLANDPHLTHLVPSIVFQVHQKTPDADVMGITVPGLPFVVAGHNQFVAWGMTSTVADAIDLVLEDPDPAVPEHVRHEGGPCPITTRTEVIRVRDGSSFLERPVVMRRTCNGPLLNDILPALFPPGMPLVAARWHVEGSERTLKVLRQMAAAKSVWELGERLGEFPSLFNTFTVADRDGHIGTFVSGEVPVRPNHLGTFPIPGWLKKYEWTDFAKGSQLPWAVDPAPGYLAHANNLMREPGSREGARLNVDAAPGYRYERIEALLKQTRKHDVDSFKAMQVDTFSLRATKLLPYLFADLAILLQSESPEAMRALELLRAWDGDARADQAGPAIFFFTWRNAVLEAMHDELSPEALRFFLLQRYSTNVADEWFVDARHPAWDDLTTPNVVETRVDCTRKAFLEAVKQLVEQQGADPTQWRWGRAHQHLPRHPFGGKSGLGGTVNLAPMESGGELDSIWKAHFDIGNDANPFKVVAGPVWRTVVDLNDLDHAWWTVDTGSSGWPKSPHYDDQYQLWKKGELAPMRFNLAEVKQLPHGTLNLVPR